MEFVVQPSAVTGGTVAVPGDKSISHRALMLAAIADGVSDIEGLLVGDDCLATLAALGRLGVTVERPEETAARVHGVGKHGLTRPDRELDLGNSGTAMRLFAGLLCGQAFDTELTGDASLSRRPMKRVITPLTMMGASIDSRNGLPPLTVKGGRPLVGISYRLPVASAQVKSAILLAGLYAKGDTMVTEPAVTRDHTERMLRSMGVAVTAENRHVRMAGRQTPRAGRIEVPGDLSSAAFPMLAALLAENAEIRIRRVGVNPTRTGVIDILRDMGADIRLDNPKMMGEEAVADLIVKSSELRAIDVAPERVSLAIDEFPVLFVAAAAAAGVSRFSGLSELRLKESDRIAAMVKGLRELGIAASETEDGAEILGGRFGGGTIDSRGDHRIAMAFAVAAGRAAAPVHVRDVAAVDTSFPGFVPCLRAAGLDIVRRDAHTA